METNLIKDCNLERLLKLEQDGIPAVVVDIITYRDLCQKAFGGILGNNDKISGLISDLDCGDCSRREEFTNYLNAYDKIHK